MIRRRVLISLLTGFLAAGMVASGRAQAPGPAYRARGSVVSVESNGFTIQTDAGTRLAVVLGEKVNLLRVAPNQKI